MKKRVLRKFGENVRHLRMERGLSQEELADRVGCHRNYIGFVERAERATSVEKVVAIIKALKCSSQDVFKGLV